MGKESIRKCAVSGLWYPSERDELLATLNVLDNTAVVVDKIDNPFGLMVPHAGYAYSGRTAASGFKAVGGKKIDKIILLGTSHKYLDGTIAFSDWEKVDTPIGSLEQDLEIANFLLMKNTEAKFDKKIHEKEHSLEALFPFIRYYMDQPQIVPILTATNEHSALVALGKSIAEAVKTKWMDTLIVVSTDMSHYHKYDEALRMDRKAISSIVSGDYDMLFQLLESRECELCAYYALIAFFTALNELDKEHGRLIMYETSGDTVPDSRANGVVGYSAMVFN